MINPFAHTPTLQQTTLNTSSQTYEKSVYNYESITIEKASTNCGKKEIAHNEQFLLLPQCVHISSAAEVSESVCMW